MKHTFLILCGLSLALSISGVEAVGNILFVFFLMPLLLSSSRRKPESSFKWEKTPLDIPLLIFAVWIVVCACVAGSADLLSVLSKQGALVLFFVAAHALEEGELKTLVVWFCAGAAVAGLWGLIQALSGINLNLNEHAYQIPSVFSGAPEKVIHFLSLRDGRAVGTRSHPLTYAETFIPAFFVLAGYLGQKFFVHHEKPASYRKQILALLLISAGLVLSQSRGVWLGLAFGSAVLLFSWPKKYALRTLSALVVCLVVIQIVSPSLRKRAMSIVSSTAGSKADRQSNSTRLDLWRQSLRIIKEKPLMGTGLNSEPLVTIQPETGVEKKWSETHNMYLQAGLDGGVVGIGLFLWILWITFSSIVKSTSPWRAVQLSIFLAFLTAGLTESWTHDKEIAFIFWAFIGAIQNKKGIV